MKKLLFVLLLTIAQHISYAQWTLLTGNNYTGIDLTDVYAHTSKIIAVGTQFPNFQGHIFLSNNAGSTWDTMVIPPVGYFFKTIAFKDADTGFIGGYGSITIWLKTTDGGQSWAYEFVDTMNSGINDMHFIDSKHGYASGYGPSQFQSGICYRTDDGGKTWSFPDSTVAPLDTIPFDYIQFITPAIGFGRPDFLLQKDILKSTDSGKTWNIAYTHSRATATMHFWDVNSGIMTDISGDVYKTINGGTTWTLATSNAFSGAAILSMSFLDQNIGVAVGDNGKIFKSINGGNSWIQQTSPTTKVLSRIRFYDGRAYVTGMDGTIISSGVLLDVNNIDPDDDISIYPNPAETNINIKSVSGRLKNAVLHIYDMMGKSVYKGSAGNNTQIDISHFAAGNYVLEIKSNEASYRKLITIKPR